MSVSYWQDTDLVGISALKCDVVIVGAGLAGLSTAYWLKKAKPTLDVVVIEKGRVGDGASGRNAGFITCGSTEHFSRMVSAYGKDKASEIWKFTEDNHKLLTSEFGIGILNKKCQYRQKGSWTLATSEQEVLTIRETVSSLKRHNVNVDWFDNNHIEDRFHPSENSPVCITGFHGGAKYHDDGEIHPGKFLRHLTLTIPGTRLISNTEVFGFDYVGEQLVVNARNIRIATDAVILCTNAWSPEISSFFKDKIVPTRGQILVTEPVVEFLEPSYCSFVLDYFRQLIDGRVLIGGFRNADVEKEVGYSDVINPIIQEKLEGFLKEHFPILHRKKIDYRWSSVMGFSKDGYPLVGSLPSDPQIYYNAGFSAHGLGYTFKMGKVISDLIMDGKDPGIFSGRRFN